MEKEADNMLLLIEVLGKKVQAFEKKYIFTEGKLPIIFNFETVLFKSEVIDKLKKQIKAKKFTEEQAKKLYLMVISKDEEQKNLGEKILNSVIK
jgi:hypothetical protein